MPPRVSESAVEEKTYDLNDMVAKAYQQRVDLDAQDARVEAAKQNAKASSATKWPTVSLTAGYNTAFNGASDSPLSTQLNDRRGGQLSIGVSIPLFDRGSTSVAEQRARIQQENAQLELDKQRQQVALDIRRAYLDRNAASEQLKAARAQVVAANQAVNATEQRYRVGASTIVEVTQARATQVQAQSALVNARYSLVFQDAQMHYYTGNLDPASVRLD